MFKRLVSPSEIMKLQLQKMQLVEKFIAYSTDKRAHYRQSRNGASSLHQMTIMHHFLQCNDNKMSRDSFIHAV